MTSSTEICNIALAHLGQEAITSLDAQNDTARKCKSFYVPYRNLLLESHNWIFATRFDELVLIDGLLDEKYEYVYAMPSNCLKIRKITTTDKKPVQYRIYSNNGNQVIATDIDGAIVEYTYKEENTSFYSASFIIALAYSLAAVLALPLTGDNTKFATMTTLSRGAVDQAELMDAQQGCETQEPYCAYIDER